MKVARYQAGAGAGSLAGVRKLPQPLAASVPEVEWWDRPFLKGADTDAESSKGYALAVNTDIINVLITHPLELAPPSEAPPPSPAPLMLTPQERKKIKRAKKMEREKEKQDLVRFGFAAPAEPRVKLSNIMRVMGTDAVADPSAVEAKVRKQAADRKAKHEAHNDGRKLTKEQKKDKIKKKLMKEKSVDVKVAVFQAGDLADERRRTKIDRNVQDLSLTGIALLHIDCNVIVVEGGPKALKKFTRLLTVRMDWKPVQHAKPEGEAAEEKPDDDEEEEEPKNYKKCVLVWTGVVAKPTFKTFRFETCRTEAMARKFLEDRGVAQYWDMARTHNPDAPPG
jgi:U4/U6 small nuclear ribonucleoprotein PRP3